VLTGDGRVANKPEVGVEAGVGNAAALFALRWLLLAVALALSSPSMNVFRLGVVQWMEIIGSICESRSWTS
jgi:hypothetical protein